MKSKTITNDDIKVVNVTFLLLKDTSVQVDPFSDNVTKEDLTLDTKYVLTELRNKANALRLNFAPAGEFNIGDEASLSMKPYKDYFVLKAGSTTGSVCASVKVETKVSNPSLDKINKIIEKSEDFSIKAITYGCSIPLEENETIEDIGARCSEKLQAKYIVLSADNDNGAKVEVADDLFCSLIIKDGLLMVRVEAKYLFQLAKKLKEFSVFEFIRDLITK